MLLKQLAKAIFLFLSIIFSAATASARDDHDIHLTLCELRYNEASSSFEIAIKIFIDDLELAIQKEGKKDFRIGSKNEDVIADEYIASYLNKFFSIEIDGIKLHGDFLGKEITEDLLAVWCYVEIPVAKRGKKCVMSNSILMEVYDDQRNIMDIKMSKSHKDYTILEKGKSTWTYTYPQH